MKIFHQGECHQQQQTRVGSEVRGGFADKMVTRLAISEEHDSKDKIIETLINTNLNLPKLPERLPISSKNFSIDSGFQCVEITFNFQINRLKPLLKIGSKFHIFCSELSDFTWIVEEM